jgi:hypothetical protein
MSHFLYRSSFNTDWWGYVAGEYGGGSWTVERSAGFGDRVDINDIRVIVGVEFRPTPAVGGAVPILRRTYVGYIEAGYVFQREIVYVSNFPASTFEPDATLMLRGGLRF